MRIMFVAMQNSVHTARWINQLADTQHEILLFPPYVAQPHKAFSKVRRLASWAGRPRPDGTVNVLTLVPLRRGAGRAEMIMESATRDPDWRVAWLKRAIRRFKPDIVQSLEFQEAGYLCLKAREEMGSEFPTWITTNWGSDILLFGKLPEHHEKIRKILLYADYYSAECVRDIKIARDFGYTGKVRSVFPNAGGFDLAAMRRFRSAHDKTSARRTIAVKGYQHFSGRALTVLDALGMAADEVRPFQIRVYSATPDVELMVRLVAADCGLDIRCLPFRSPREDILRLHGSSRLSIGVGISDGISTSFLEALVMGSFPIQSNTACADEWITDGETGFVVSPHDPVALADRIRRVAADDALVDAAARTNAETANTKLEYQTVKHGVKKMYESIEKGEDFPYWPNEAQG